MVSGMPSPIPCGVFWTYRDRKKARRRGAMSVGLMERPWQMDTIFSVMNRMSPGSRCAGAYFTMTSVRESSGETVCVAIGMRS
jgi:hypothetical protein